MTAVERASHISERKRLFEQRTRIKNSHNGTGCPENRRRGRPTGFASKTAEKTLRSKRDVNRDIHRAEQIASDVMKILESAEIGSILAKIASIGTELDALASMHHDEQRRIIREIKQGNRTAVRPATNAEISVHSDDVLNDLKQLWRVTNDQDRLRFVAWLRAEYRHMMQIQPAARVSLLMHGTHARR